jgi:predicted O-methyltransferase YrrM
MKNKTLQKALTLLPEGPTHVLEFGVYKGASIQALRNNLSRNFMVFGFDSFEGLPEPWVGTDTKPSDFSAKGVVPDIEGVVFYKGWFKDTIPRYLEIGEPIALLHIDCDLYSSTKTVLESLEELIIPGTVIVFDEWFYNHKDIPQNRLHEQKAFYEWIHRTGREYELQKPLENERQIVVML